MPDVPPDRISHYRIAQELGKGSMGIVYEGVPDNGGQPVPGHSAGIKPVASPK
jgi:hypothetical protein